MNRVPRFVWTLLLCLTCTVVTAACCLLLGDKGATSDKYLEIIRVLEDNSVDAVEVSTLENASAEAMVASLGDDWSYYMDTEEYQKYLLNASNQYVGVGITTEFNKKYGYLAVTSVAAGSPAAMAQIEIGNMITTVNNTDVSTFSPEDLTGYLESFGEEEFTLGLQNAQGGTRSVKLKCEIIYAPPVIWRIEDNVIGYVRIQNFEEGCFDYLKEAIASLKKDGARSILLDVRDNPGGRVEELKNVLDYLVGKGDLFICRDRNGKETMYSSGSDKLEMPMVVLINGKSENEAEMFATVMQSFGAATIVGERTSGNGHNQVVLELSDQSAVRVSKYSYLTAERKDLQTLGGVVPDIRSTAIEDSSLDVILEAAKDVVG